MLQNAYLLAKIGADTAENEQHFAEILPKIGNYPTGPLPRVPGADSGAVPDLRPGGLVSRPSCFQPRLLATFCRRGSMKRGYLHLKLAV